MTQKVAKVKGREKGGESHDKKIGTGNRKKSKFWPMRMSQIEISQSFVLNLREIYLFGKKKK